MNEIYQQAKLLQSELVKVRREIHQNAEVGTQLPHTKALVKEKLIAYGYEPRDIANSSVVATNHAASGRYGRFSHSGRSCFRL